MNFIAIGALLFALFLLIVALMVWQEARKTPETTAVYVIEEAVPFAYARLSDRALTQLAEDDVLRILEWEVRYLQGLDVPRDHGEQPAPVAGSPEAVEFIRLRCAADGHHYSRHEIEEVLSHELAYLVDIGAVGTQVEGDPA
jgi:hypothetical protein